MPGKLLKLLAGPHQGAEVDLPEGTTTLGSSSECDLILDDAALADKHLAFTVVNGGQLQVKFFKSGFIDLKPIEAGREVEVPDWQPISIGSTCVGIGPRDAPWPPIVAPDWAKLMAMAVPTPAASPSTPVTSPGQGGVGDAVITGDIPRSTDSANANLSVDIQNTTSLPDPLEAANSIESTRLRRRSSAIPTLIGVLLLTAISAVVVYEMLPGEEGAPDAPVAPIASDIGANLNAIASKHGLKIELKDTNYQLSGLVATAKEREDIVQEVSRIAPTASCQVYSREQVEAAATAVLHGFKYAVTAKFDDSGALHLDGWAPSDSAWKHALLRLRNDVPGDVSLTENVRFLSDISSRLLDDLSREGLGSVRLTLENGVLTCKGSVPENRAEVWKQLVATWRSDYSVIRTIQDQTMLVSSSAGSEGRGSDDNRIQGIALPGPIVSTMLDPVRCFKTADGSVYFEGATLADGFVVTQISSTGITFKRGESEIREYSLLRTDGSITPEPQTKAAATEGAEDAKNAGH